MATATAIANIEPSHQHQLLTTFESYSPLSALPCSLFSLSPLSRLSVLRFWPFYNLFLAMALSFAFGVTSSLHSFPLRHAYFRFRTVLALALFVFSLILS